MKNLSRYLAAGLSGVLLVSLGTSCGKTSAKAGEAVSYVGIDVNPSVSLVLDKDNKVLSVVAENEDAQVLLYGEASLVGLDAENAAKKIAELAVELGYLNEDNYGVNITVESKASAEKLTNGIEAAFTASADGLGLNFTTDGTFSVNRELKAANAEYNLNLSVGKFRLILEAQSADNTLTVEAAADMDVSELLEIINDAAETVEPYATKAYYAAKEAASYTYNMAKGQLLDSLWLTPYINYAPEVLLGKKVNYGMIYNMYTSSSRAMQAGLAAAEAAAELARETTVSDATLNAIAEALDMTDEEKTAFVNQVTEDGKTVAALDKYFNIYFKNMTADERAAAKAKAEEVMAKVQEEADKIDAAIAQEYKDALNRLCKDLTALIPSEILNTTNTYLTEFKALVNDIQTAVNGKEPMAAAYAAKRAIDERSEKVMEAMKADLKQEEVDSVNAAIEKLSDKLATIEQTYQNALAEAEKTAKDYLSALKESRKPSTAA